MSQLFLLLFPFFDSSWKKINHKVKISYAGNDKFNSGRPPNGEWCIILGVAENQQETVSSTQQSKKNTRKMVSESFHLYEKKNLV